MNSGFFRWLFSLSDLPEGSGELRLAWERPMPGWVWMLVIAAAIALAVFSYRRMFGSRPIRIGLASLRAVLLILIFTLLAGPQAELPRDRVEPDRVIVLVDRSRSMEIEDATLDDDSRVSRESQLDRVLGDASNTFRTLSDARDVKWYGFHEGAFALPTSDDGLSAEERAAANTTEFNVVVGDPTGEQTDIGRAISQVIARAGARQISGVLILSDGRSTRPVDPGLVRRLRSEAVPVYATPLGAADPIGDLAVGRVDAPRRAFVHDKVPVRIGIDRFGAGVSSIGGTVRLIDDTTGEELDSMRLEDAIDDVATLVAEPEVVGDATWSVVVEPDEADLVPRNNRLQIAIELVDRPMRVLFVEGYPRWEYRYLKNLLVREKSIESSVMLLSADRDFAQEGNAPITRLPRTAEEFEDFDVIVLGDLPASFFSPDQLDLIRDHVAERGAGLLWIAGERETPGSYADTVLADLLPLSGGLNLPAFDGPVNMEPTLLADRLGVLQLESASGRPGWPQSLRDKSYRWSQLWYAQRIDPERLKPTAEVLATTVAQSGEAMYPLVMSMRYGAGQSIYVATDEIWRWRYGRGERFVEQFWIQMIRLLGRASLATAGDRGVLTIDPRRSEIGAPVRVRMELLDATLVDERRPSIGAVIVDGSGRVVGRLELIPESAGSERYATTWIPDRAGPYTVRLDEPELMDAGLELSADVEVLARADELQRPETDHEALRSLASETGGAIITPAALAAGDFTLPNRSITTENPLREPIWDAPIVFVVILLLLTLEWVGRRLLRLA